jgi:hypothetical protein
LVQNLVTKMWQKVKQSTGFKGWLFFNVIEKKPGFKFVAPYIKLQNKGWTNAAIFWNEWGESLNFYFGGGGMMGRW